MCACARVLCDLVCVLSSTCCTCFVGLVEVVALLYLSDPSNSICTPAPPVAFQQCITDWNNNSTGAVPPHEVDPCSHSQFPSLKPIPRHTVPVRSPNNNTLSAANGVPVVCGDGSATRPALQSGYDMAPSTMFVQQDHAGELPR